MFTTFRRVFSQKVFPNPIPLSSFSGKNEPIMEYKKDSKERKMLEEALGRMSQECPQIPIAIGKDKLITNDKQVQKIPHLSGKSIANFSYAGHEIIKKAIDEAVTTQDMWRRVKLDEKHKIWHNAADLMAGKYRQDLNASIMLGQSKTVIQAEIDTVELIDFLRFGADYLLELAKFKPISTDPKVSYNTYKLRPLDGFVAAVTPFNFTAIGGNLAFTPTLLGNCTVWKPSDSAILSNWIVYKIMMEAGVPPGVVSFVPSKPEVFGDTVTKSPSFAGLNFTGSVATFRKLWTMTANNLNNYSCFPRLVGECGGKNYHFVHPTAEINTVANATIRSAFEYSGQKCSACSRMYVPESLWGPIAKALQKGVSDIKVGDVRDFSVFTSAVIDEKAYDRIVGYLQKAENNPALELIAGRGYSKTQGYYVKPTIIKTKDPLDPIMKEEIFGPVLTVYVYKDSEVLPTLYLVKNSTDYALTGAIFSRDEKFLIDAEEILRMSAGNFYINDKCTGSVVGQQPFGGSKLSGTNDKAGSPHYLLRWASPQVIKETFVPQNEYKYPYMQ